MTTDPAPGLARRHDDFPPDWEPLDWVALRVAASAEFLTADRLASLGIPTVAPLRIEMVRRAGRAKAKVPATFPLLTGYLFAAPLECEWRTVMGLRHVGGVVGVAGRPARVGIGELKALCRRSAGGEFRSPEYLRAMRADRRAQAGEPRFRPGDRVAIADPESVLDGRVVEVADLRGEAARVLLPMLGAVREAWISVDRIRAA